MKNLEHNIKNVFSESDTNTSFSSKETMWIRLENTMHYSGGMVAFWRVAAILMSVLLFTVVFAGLILKTEQQKSTHELLQQNLNLRQTVDSLLSQPVQLEPEIQVVEKVVYRDRFFQHNKTEKSIALDEKNDQTSDSLEIMLLRELHYLNEIKQLQDQLADKNELATSQIQNEQKKMNELVQLKSERVELRIQKTSAVKSQEIEVKIFPKNYIQKTNDLNKTLFNKK